MPTDENKPGFIRSVKGKIIIASVLACFALFLAWSTSKNAFKTVLSSFEDVTTPNNKLRLIREISGTIAGMDHVQKAMFSKKNGRYNDFFGQTKKLGLKIDTLKAFYADRPNQVKRLNELKELLDERDKLYLDYINVRAGLINYKSFASQVELLNAMVNESARQTDTLATSSIKNTSTVTYLPVIAKKEKKQRPGFFKRLFGKKDTTASEPENKQAFSIVDSNLKVKKDTAALAMRDSMLKDVGRTIRNIERTQQNNSTLFVRKETMLNSASAKIIGQAQAILKRVQNEAIAQADASNRAASQVVKSSMERIGLILVLFFILLCLLVYLILRDVSRINRYRQQIEAARDEAEYHAVAKQRFLSNMSHEIRTPLQSILGYSELAKKRSGPADENIEAIYNSSNHLLQIVNEALDYNRIISGKFSFTKEPFDILSTINEVVTALHPQAANKGILLKTHYDPSVAGLISGDAFRLKQVLYNLIGNAIKFTTEGEVCLKVVSVDRANNCWYRFDVTDTGAGLSAEDIDRIFTEFEQAGDEKQAKTGTGLGLAISKQIIELQSGNLRVKSKRGKGSCFTFELPFGKVENPEQIIAGRQKIDKSAYPGKIWIVDDDTFILNLTAQLCRENHINCSLFEKPSEILNAPWDDDVEVLLVDIRMPEMSGIELCHLMRNKLPPGTRIYALTAQVMPEEHQVALKGGFNGILTKPFTEKQLLDLLRKDALQQTEGNADVDLTAIKKMTFDDPKVMAEILKRFAKDSLNDIEELRRAAQKRDVAILNLLLHRIAGRTAQVGEKQLAHRFRALEIKVNDENNVSDEISTDISNLITELHGLAEKMGNYQFKASN